MDMDIQLIDAVRNEPYLYLNSYNLEERDKCWRRLAQKFQVNDQHLKIRWHFLLQRYQRDAAFKYAKQMDFVKRIREDTTQTDNFPEFVINEEDIMKYNTNTTEYIFMDIEDIRNDEDACEDEEQIDLVENVYTSEEEEEDFISMQTSEQYSNESEENIRTIEIKLVNSENKGKREDKQKIATHINPIDTHSDEEVVIETAEEVALIGTKNLSSIQENRASITATNTPPKRAEDDIFGELVAAMLAPMEREKKRRTKKEIMNLLLS